MKKAAACLLIALLIINIPVGAFADTKASGSTPVTVFLKPDISVEYHGVKKLFKDVKGNIAFPIIYKGRTYLPLRSISGLMNKPIVWDDASKTVFIGKSMSDPDGSTAEPYSNTVINAADVGNNVSIGSQPEMDRAYLKQDVIVMYDFVIKSFQNEQGETVNPVNYKGATYLPIRAIACIMNETVTWDENTKTISIGQADTDKPGKAKGTKIKDEDSKVMQEIKSAFNSTESIYYEATLKITEIKGVKSQEQKLAIAKSITENYETIRKLADEVKLRKSFGSLDEVTANDKVIAFAEETEYYLLMLENMAYLSASGQDYSMFEDMFLDTSLKTQDLMNDARAFLNK